MSKGFKVCVNCSATNGCRSIRCKKCNKVFASMSKIIPIKKEKTSDKPFEGSKKCLKCSHYVRKKSKRCANCNIAFPSKEYRDLKNAIVKEQRDKEKAIANLDVKARTFAKNVGFPNNKIVFATGNLITKPPLSITQEDVIDWVYDHMLDEHNRLRYISVFVSSLSRLLPQEDFQICRKHITEWWRKHEKEE